MKKLFALVIAMMLVLSAGSGTPSALAQETPQELLERVCAELAETTGEVCEAVDESASQIRSLIDLVAWIRLYAHCENQRDIIEELCSPIEGEGEGEGEGGGN